MNGEWTRRCHRCNRFFKSTTRHGKVCPACSEKAYRKMLRRKRRKVNVREVHEGYMKKIKKLGILLT